MPDDDDTTTELPNYLVRLLMTSHQVDPGAAVRSFVDSLTQYGLRNWMYRVEDYDTGDAIGLFDGFGVEIPSEALEPEKTDVQPNPPGETSPFDDRAPSAQVDTADEDLLAYAETMPNTVTDEPDPNTPS